jgi:sulfatase modifying factor 1
MPTLNPQPADDAVKPAASGAPAAAPTSTGPTSCAEGMVLVEGDYCTKVEQKCLVQWYAPQNKKKVCEQFEAPTRCVGKRIKKRFCIDKYSWPNKKGVRPEVMNTFFQAQVKCAAMGKRMCGESEWNFACEGPEMKPFPHGYTRDPKKCNGDHKWDNPKMSKVGKRDGKELARLWRGLPSGSQPECVSDFGVHDLPANNDEVVAGEKGTEKHSSVHTGGPWYSGVRNQCRPKVYTHGADFYYYFLGFRCCSEPDGKPNETLTKKQKRGRKKWDWVERMAGFTTDQMTAVLGLKDKGGCNCVDNKLPGIKLRRSPRWLCDTMCGTLLAPGAVDGSDSTRSPHRSRRKIHK